MKKLWLYVIGGVVLVCCIFPCILGGITTSLQRVGILPTNTPNTPTPQPTETLIPAPTEAPTKAISLPSAEPTSLPIIIDVFAVLGKPLAEVEPLFGEAKIITPTEPGALQSIPEGGEVRDYTIGELVFSLGIDPGGIVRWVSISGLESEGYSLEQHRELLSRLNIHPANEPDVTAPAAVRWENSNGYHINVGAGIDRPIGIVNIWQVR